MILQKTLLSIIFCSVNVWAWGNLSLAEEIQTNPTGLELTPPLSSPSQGDVGLKTPSPDIFFPETKHAFGKVFVGEKIEHVFKLENRGDTVLDIETIKFKDYPNISAQLNNWIVPPGGSGELKVTFSPAEDTGTGKMAKFVYVFSNDPDSPKFKLIFTANVLRDVTFKPRGFKLGFVPRGSAGTKRIEFDSKITPNFKITKVSSDNPLFSASHGKLNDEKRYYVEASVKGDAPLGQTKGTVIIHTNSEKQPKIMIPIFAEIVPEVKALKERVCFGKVTRGAEVLRSLTVLHAKNVKVEKVESSLSWITPVLVPENNADVPSTKTDIELKLLSNNAPKGRFEGAVSIYTNSKKLPVVKVHTCANVKEPQDLPKVDEKNQSVDNESLSSSPK